MFTSKFILLCIFVVFLIWLIRRVYRSRQIAQRSIQAAAASAPQSQSRWPVVVILVVFSCIVLLITGRGAKSLLAGLAVLVVVWSIALIRMRRAPQVRPPP